ncbi:hypothetical protein UFOVP1083_1 [uncultured Caudovirales phage]|uniref:Uncharacterized protein n=2 Tax=uncultured Caudovirales phage TaxID=2100421 RepID=A0A6J5QFX2_9CAUD|nr:hypothetical protein UFOVP1083_1 [uncultured Caudovirales phage]
MKEQELFDSGVIEQVRRAVADVLDKVTSDLSAGVLNSVLDTLTADDCPPHGISRPLVVNGETVVTCYDCDLLYTTSNTDLDDYDHEWRCYGCLSLDTGDGWGSSPEVTHPTITD